MPWAADGSKELTDMDEEAETKAIEKWLRMVDKPLATKERDKKDAGWQAVLRSELKLATNNTH